MLTNCFKYSLRLHVLPFARVDCRILIKMEWNRSKHIEKPVLLEWSACLLPKRFTNGSLDFLIFRLLFDDSFPILVGEKKKVKKRRSEREKERGREGGDKVETTHDVESDRHDIHVSARVQLAFLTFRLMYTFGTNRYHVLLPSPVPTVTWTSKETRGTTFPRSFAWEKKKSPSENGMAHSRHFHFL